jgi:hypothetical protein
MPRLVGKVEKRDKVEKRGYALIGGTSNITREIGRDRSTPRGKRYRELPDRAGSSMMGGNSSSPPGEKGR